MIPKQLQKSQFNFVLLGEWNKIRNKKTKKIKLIQKGEWSLYEKTREWDSLGKAPYEVDWQNKHYSYSDTKMDTHKGNYGVIGGYGNLCIVDIDEEELGKELEEKFNTFTIKTGSGGKHFYFIVEDKIDNAVLVNECGEIRANNYQVVGPNCIHPNGNKYEVYKNVAIKSVNSKFILAILAPHLRKTSKDLGGTEISNETDTSRSARDYREVCRLIGLGKNKEEVYLEMNAFAKWSSASDQYRTLTYNNAHTFIESNKKVEKKANEPKAIFTTLGQVQNYHENKPYFYDHTKNFFIWDLDKKKYSIGDETDILGNMSEEGTDTISSKSKTEIVNGLKQYGRKKIPKNTPLSWVQFKDKIVDFKTGEEQLVTPEYFVTSPIPWELGAIEDTPVMDKLITEWVGEEYRDTLYEVIAYSVCQDQFMQRLIALVGSGANGKGTFLGLLEKFIGSDNVVTSELKELSGNQFETSAIHKKSVCILGEIFSEDLKNTNQVKKLSGQDKIRYCYKGKTPFSEMTITTIIAATNSLPRTPDKTIGFYRRWLIIDFPNQFQIKQGLIETIPEVEFNNLGRKIIRILSELHKKQAFTNEGDYEEREKRYEARSNPVIRFVEDKCLETPSKKIPLKHFTNVFNEYSKENHLRVMTVKQVGIVLREEGFEVSSRNIKLGENDYDSVKVILNLELKTTKTTKTTIISSQNPRGTLGVDVGSFGSLGSEDIKDIEVIKK